MFIGGKTPAATSPRPSPATASNSRSTLRRALSKSVNWASNVGLEGQTRLTSMVILRLQVYELIQLFGLWPQTNHRHSAVKWARRLQVRDANELHRRKTERIGTVRRARGE